MLKIYRKQESATSAVSSDPSISAVVKYVNLVIQHDYFFNILDHLAPIVRRVLWEWKR